MSGPAIRRRQLGRELRRLREVADVKPQAAAEWLAVTTSTLSKIEHGRQSIKIGHIRGLCQLYNIEAPEADTLLRLARESNQRGWWVAYGETVPDWFRDYIGLESDAEEICAWDVQLVHGLLQIPEYVRAVVRAARPGCTEQDLARQVEIRKERQRRFNSNHPPELRVVMDEAVVRRTVGGPEVMRAQLRHLTDTSEMPNVVLQVLPFDVGAHPAMIGPFTLLRFEEDLGMDAVYLETDRGALYPDRPADLAHYTEVFRRLTEAALGTQETRDLLATLAARS